MDCAGESGASSWLLAIPIEEHHCSLSKDSFRDALCLRYGWNITNVSSRCACGAIFDVDHAMSCHKDGLPTLCHTEVRDITTEMIKEECTNVEIEPRLQHFDRENLQLRTANCEDEARLDLRATGFWSRGQEAFFDVWVFTLAPPHIKTRILSRCSEPMKLQRNGNM